MKIRENLVGREFNYLKVIEDSGERKNRATIWKCSCKCGNEVKTLATKLKKGDTKSCGCFKNENLKT